MQRPTGPFLVACGFVWVLGWVGGSCVCVLVIGWVGTLCVRASVIKVWGYGVGVCDA